MNMLVIGVLLAVVGIVTGLLASVVTRGEPPYGVLGDVVAATLVMVIVGLVEWAVMPGLGFTGWIRLAGTFGDPWALAILVLWLLRRSKR